MPSKFHGFGAQNAGAHRIAGIKYRTGRYCRKTSYSKSDQIILHCKAGVRSLKAAKVLKQMGFEDVKSMAGGIEAWSERIDPSIPKY